MIIPRGGKGLIERISARGQGAGDQAPGRQLPRLCRRPCDLAMAVTVADNAKTQKYSPCNAIEALLVHAGVAARLPADDRRGASRPRASRCAATPTRWRAAAASPGAKLEDGDRAGLVRGIPRAHHQHQGGRRRSTRRSRTSTATARTTPTRSSPTRPRQRDALPARGRLGQRDGQRQHALRRRLRVRPGRRDRHQHRQVPRPRPGRPRRPHLAQVDRARPRESCVPSDPRRALVLFSGGQDSTVCLA